MDSKASVVYPEQRIIGRACWLHRQARDLRPLNLTLDNPHCCYTPLGDLVPPHLCRRKRVGTSCFVEIIVAFVTGFISQMQVNDGPVSPVPLPSPITPNFASAMRMKIEGEVVSEGSNPDVQDEGIRFRTCQDSACRHRGRG